MPSEEYNRLTDADVAAVIAYARTLPSAPGGAAEMTVPLPMKAVYAFGVMKDAAEKIDHTLPPSKPVPEAISVEHDYTLLEHINDHGRLCHQLGLDFTLLWVVSTHRGHKRSRPHVFKIQERRARGRAGHDCITDQCSFTQIINGRNIDPELRRHLG